MKTLVIFDFDDTLFESETQVIVKSRKGHTRYLSSGEYASYVPHHEDELDFSQFEAYPTSPKPILASIERMRRAVDTYGIDNVIILTARANDKPVYEVLTDFSLPHVYVATMGSSNPVAKAEFVVQTIKEEQYQRVIVLEDNVKNIEAIKSAVIPILGERNFKAYNVRRESEGHILIRH